MKNATYWKPTCKQEVACEIKIRNMDSVGSINEEDALRDVCELLLAEGIIDKEYQKSLQTSSVKKWYQSLSQALSDHNKEDPLRLEMDSSFFPKCNVKVVARLLLVLRECMLTHRWKAAVSVLQGIAGEPRNTCITLWKISMELLYKCPQRNSGLIDQQIRNLKRLPGHTGREVILEYIMYLLHTANLQEAKYTIQEAPLKKGNLYGRDKYTELLFQGYQGLVWYSEWLTTKLKLEDTETQEKDESFLQGADLCNNYEDTMKALVEKAGACFSYLYSESGVWDIFITKHVEMLEHCQRFEEALQILEKYRDQNWDNVNSHRYVYEFWVKHEADDQNLLQHLQRVAECCPSDSLVLDLCDKLLSVKKTMEALPWIFALQDYSCWQHHEKSWEMLSKIVSSVIRKSKGRQVLENCWESRRSWWPVYHFVYSAAADCSPQVWMYKACCSTVLQQSEKSFLSDVKRILNDEQKTELSLFQQKARRKMKNMQASAGMT